MNGSNKFIKAVIEVFQKPALMFEVCHCSRSGGIDEDIKPIVDALNSAGIKTIASCCGHTFQPSSVILEHNGVTKELRLFTFEQARTVDKLFSDINGDANKTLLDEFAIAAMSALCPPYGTPCDAVAKDAYNIAAAMMAERDRRDEKGKVIS